MIEYRLNSNGSWSVVFDDVIVATFARVGDQFEVQGGTSGLVADGLFPDMDAAEKYIRKCLEGVTVQTTEQEVISEKAKIKQAAKNRTILRKLESQKPLSNPDAEDNRQEEIAERRAELAKHEQTVTPAPKPGKPAPAKPGRKPAASLGEKLEAVADKAAKPSRKHERGPSTAAAKNLTDAKARRAEQLADAKVIKDQTCIDCGTIIQDSRNHAYILGWRASGKGGWSTPICGGCRAK